MNAKENNFDCLNYPFSFNNDYIKSFFYSKNNLNGDKNKLLIENKENKKVKQEKQETNSLKLLIHNTHNNFYPRDNIIINNDDKLNNNIDSNTNNKNNDYDCDNLKKNNMNPMHTSCNFNNIAINTSNAINATNTNIQFTQNAGSNTDFIQKISKTEKQPYFLNIDFPNIKSENSHSQTFDTFNKYFKKNKDKELTFKKRKLSIEDNKSIKISLINTKENSTPIKQGLYSSINEIKINANSAITTTNNLENDIKEETCYNFNFIKSKYKTSVSKSNRSNSNNEIIFSTKNRSIKTMINKEKKQIDLKIVQANKELNNNKTEDKEKFLNLVNQKMTMNKFLKKTLHIYDTEKTENKIERPNVYKNNKFLFSHLFKDFYNKNAEGEKIVKFKEENKTTEMDKYKSIYSFQRKNSIEFQKKNRTTSMDFSRKINFN